MQVATRRKMALRYLLTFLLLGCLACHGVVGQATPANYLLTTAHSMVNLDALRAANPGKCCIPLPGGPAGVAYLNTDQYYAATKSDCTDALTAAQYPVKAGFVWACGCKGGPCKGKGGRVVVPPGNTCGDKNGPFADHTCMEGTSCQQHGTQYRCRLPCGSQEMAPFYLNTTGHKIMLSDLKAKAGSTCCYKVAPINDRILYLSTKNAYASGDAECKSLWTVATYPLSFTHIWLCGCPGGDCAQSKKLSSTIGGNTFTPPGLRCGDAKGDWLVRATCAEGNACGRMDCQTYACQPYSFKYPTLSCPAQPLSTCKSYVSLGGSCGTMAAEDPTLCCAGNDLYCGPAINGGRTCRDPYIPFCNDALVLPSPKPSPSPIPKPSPSPSPKPTPSPAPVPKPCACPKDYRPVCYNGKEYSNICLAKCEFPALKDADAKPGPCPKPCPCPKDYRPVCYNGKEYSNICLAKCEFPALKDADAKPGPCPKPCPCPKNYAPVCYNGKEYANICLAKCEFPSLKDADAKPGPCPKACACPKNLAPVCYNGKEFSNICLAKCEFPTLKDADAKPGPCPKPCPCPMNYAPVCYNGKEYSNICLAKCANPGLKDADAKPGPCPKACPCPKNLAPVCANGKEFSNICLAKCEFPTLKDADAKPGPCPKPCACPKNLAPVCYNGKEYSNICLAKCEFPTLKEADAKPGPCPKACPCPRDYRPVCANGKQFSNACEAKCLLPALKDADIKQGPCANTITTLPATATPATITPRTAG